MYPMKFQNIFIPNTKLKDLGIVRPDNTIWFCTEKTARKYAKNRVIQALNKDEPFERGIIYRQNIILREFDGTTNSIRFSLSSEELSDNLVFVHGHPFPRFNPLSIDDFLGQIIGNFKEMVAYNVFGEFSSLKKMFTNVLTFEECKKLGKAVADDAFFCLSEMFPKKQQLYAECIMHCKNSYLDLKDENLAEIGQNIVENYPEVFQQYAKEANRLTEEGLVVACLDKFFRNNARRFGYKYSMTMQKNS